MKRLIALALLAILIGCASPRCPDLPGGPRYCLQSTSALPPYSALQDIRIQRGELDERLIAQLEVDAAGMRLVGLTPMGQRILEADFDNNVATASSVVGRRFDVRSLLSMVQLAVWPADSVRAGLGEGCEIEESPALRRLLREGMPILEIARIGEPPRYRRLDIHVPNAGFSLAIQDLEEDD